METKTVPKWALNLILGGALSLMTLLGAGNIYFAGILISQFLRTNETVWDLRQQVALLRQSFDDYKQTHATRGTSF